MDVILMIGSILLRWRGSDLVPAFPTRYIHPIARVWRLIAKC